ncbi:MAG: polymer-forming cytoskeletal protein [Thermodesulfobacteriota bacterium]|nr:polymer-forming cytoskeletal protein [Thermodesulfobacteriota bacterium]
MKKFIWKTITDAPDTYIAAGTNFEGSLFSEKGLRIDGVVKGSIESGGHLIVGTEGIIEANIKARDVTIGGEVKGNIFAANRLEITPTGKIKGDIETDKLIISEGVIFEGHCHMTRSEIYEGNEIKEVFPTYNNPSEEKI